MKLFEISHHFNHSWEEVSRASWQKYPNKITPHILSVDIISSEVDPITGVLRSERILTCKQGLPDFIHKWFKCDNIGYIYEVSEVDMASKKMTLSSRNLSMSHVLRVDESLVYQTDAQDESRTVLNQQAKISVPGVSFSCLKNKIEDFCVSRFRSNSQLGRQALQQVLDRISTFPEEQSVKRY